MSYLDEPLEENDFLWDIVLGGLIAFIVTMVFWALLPSPSADDQDDRLYRLDRLVHVQEVHEYDLWTCYRSHIELTWNDALGRLVCVTPTTRSTP
jgi:hypothetical protein